MTEGNILSDLHFLFLTFSFLLGLQCYCPRNNLVTKKATTVMHTPACKGCGEGGSSFHGILKARILERVAFPSPGDLSNPRNELGHLALQADALPSQPPGKPMINLDSILKSRDITLLTKAHLVMTVVFPVVMYGCESWNVKKGKC